MLAGLWQVVNFFIKRLEFFKGALHAQISIGDEPVEGKEPEDAKKAVVKILADAFREAAGEPKHLEFLDNMDQPLLLLDVQPRCWWDLVQ